MVLKRAELPYLLFESAISVVGELYSRGGGAVSKDDFGTLIKNSVKSSSFIRKLNAMKNFGLVETSGSDIRLTDLGNIIAAPESPQQRAQSLAQAFLSIDLFRRAYEKFKGGILPERQFLANSFQALGAPAALKDGWAQQFRDSGIAAGLLRDEGGKIRVLTSPSTAFRAFTVNQLDEIDTETSEAEGQVSGRVISAGESKDSPHSDDSLVIPFGSGRQIRIQFPPDLKVSELKTLMRMLDVYLESKVDSESGEPAV
jgi:hypothetical protein